MSSRISELGKRKADLHEQLPAKRQAREKNDESLRKLFDIFAASISSAYFPETALKELKKNKDVKYGFPQYPYKLIKREFNQYLSEGNYSRPLKKEIMGAFRKVFTLAIEKSMGDTLIERSEMLPSIQQKMQHRPELEIQKLVKEGRVLRRQAPDVENLPRINALLNQLGEYRDWKLFQDPLEYEHILFLCERYEIYADHLLADYKPIVEKIQELSPQLKEASDMVLQLRKLQMQLQELKKATAPVPKEDLLETRFLKAFAPPFYFAHAQHFWCLLENSKSDPEISKIISDSDWERGNSDAQINQIWAHYFPDHTFEDWILCSLRSMTAAELNDLEKALQEQHVKFNQAHENKSNSRWIHIEPRVKEVMNGFCIAATKPPFSTLKELKAFLGDKTEK